MDGICLYTPVTPVTEGVLKRFKGRVLSFKYYNYYANSTQYDIIIKNHRGDYTYSRGSNITPLVRRKD